MVWSMRMIKQPTGVFDVTTVRFKGIMCFAVSFGRLVRIYDTTGSLQGELYHSVSIQKILAYAEGYFLFSSDRYFYYTNDNMITKEYISIPLGKIHHILLHDNTLLILSDSGYTFLPICERRVEWKIDLTDSPFYMLRSAAQTQSCFYILADSHRRTYMLTFRKDNLQKRYSRREVERSEVMFSINEDVFVLNQSSIWLYGDKSIEVTEYGRGAVSCIVSGADKAIIFCESGEVVEATFDGNKRLTLTTKTRLKEKITSASVNSQILFCGSIEHSYLLDKDYRILRSWCGIGEVEGVRWNNGIEYRTRSEIFRLGRGINPGTNLLRGKKTYLIFSVSGSQSSAKESITPYGTLYDPILVFKKGDFYCLSFPYLSLICGHILQSVNKCYSFQDIIAFSTSDYLALLDARSIMECAIIYRLRISWIKYYENMAVLYNEEDTIFCLDIQSKKWLKCKSLHKVENIVCESKGILIISPEIDFIRIPYHEMEECDMNEERQNIQDLAYKSPIQLTVDKRLLEFVLSGEDGYLKESQKYLNTNDYLWKAGESSLFCISRTKRYVRQVSDVGGFLLLHSSDGMWLFDPESGRCGKICGQFFCGFVREGALYLCSKESLHHIHPKFSSFISWSLHTELGLFERLLYCNSRTSVILSHSLDMKSLHIKTTKSQIIYPESAYIGYVPLDGSYLCLLMHSLKPKTTSLRLLHIAKGEQLREIQSIDIGEIGYAITGREKYISVLFSEGVLLYKISHGRLHKKKLIRQKIDYCKKSFFLTKRIVAFVCEDATFWIVNFRKKTPRRKAFSELAHPFLYKNKICSFTSSFLSINNSVVIDCGEKIVHVFSHACEIFVLCQSGSVYLLREIPFERNQRNILNNLYIPYILADLNWIDIDLISNLTCKKDTDNEFKTLLEYLVGQ